MLRFVAFALAMLMSAPLQAQNFDDIVRGELLGGWRDEGGRHIAAIRLSLSPGWKTYWRAPGDAGIPPDFDWTGSGNLAAVSVRWPTPEVFRQAGMRSVGYAGDVVIPVELHPSSPGGPIDARVTLRIGVCEDVCIPVTLKLANRFASDTSDRTQTVAAALKDRPMTEREAGVGRVTCETEPISDGVRLKVRIAVPPLAPMEDVVIETGDPSIWVSEPTSSREGGVLEAVADMVPPNASPFALSRQDVRVTVLGAGRAIDIRGCTGA